MLSDSEHKMSVVVLFGGMSSEHEVSRVSAGTFVDQLDRQRYELLTIGITKEGRWLYTEADSARWPTQLGRAAGQYALRAQPRPCRPRPHPLHPRRAGGEGPCGRGHPRAPRPVGRGRHRAGSAGAGRHPLRRLRRSGQRGLHGQGSRQRHVRRLRHPSHQVALRHPLGDRV